VVTTPGHTKGGACYILENNSFSGDTLFQTSYGRTDLPTGDYNALKESLNKLFALEGDYNVYPGHGAQTTLDIERKHNLINFDD
ncbi:MAG: MBL fold metallo-hydrolase, partial [Clostridia bacterium]|nr:MBL fold metallo-hydrolase [Clostridia bacterium]